MPVIVNPPGPGAAFINEIPPAMELLAEKLPTLLAPFKVVAAYALVVSKPVVLMRPEPVSVMEEPDAVRLTAPDPVLIVLPIVMAPAPPVFAVNAPPASVTFAFSVMPPPAVIMLNPPVPVLVIVEPVVVVIAPALVALRVREFALAQAMGVCTSMLPTPSPDALVVSTVTLVELSCVVNVPTLRIDVVTPPVEVSANVVVPFQFIEIVLVAVLIVMFTGSSSRLPVIPCAAVVSTNPANPSHFLPEVSTQPPLPDSAPPRAEMLPLN